MRALIRSHGLVRFESRHPDVSAGPDEAIVRPTLAAISRLDAAVADGLFSFEGVLGHQFVGIVESTGDSRHRKLVGGRVVATVTTSCMTCAQCRAGLAPHCRNRTILGLQGRDGCLAERIAVPVVNLVAVPDSVDDDAAVFAQPLGDALHAVNQIHFPGKPYVTVLGDGPMGLLCAQALARLNASVRIIGHHPDKMALAEKWGIRHRPLQDIGRRNDQDVVIDATGSPDGLAVALTLVRPRGKILVKSLIGPGNGNGGVDLTAAVMNEIEVLGSGLGRAADALPELQKRSVDVVSLISRRYRFEDAAAALAASRDPGHLRILVDL